MCVCVYSEKSFRASPGVGSFWSSLCIQKPNKSPASWGKLAEGGLQGVVHESRKGELEKKMVATVRNFAPGPSRE